MTQVIIEFFVKFLAWALPFTLRWRYPAARIDKLILVRVAAQGDGIEIWNGDMPHARASIEVINLSPFHLEVERSYGTFEYGSSLEKFTYIRRVKLPPASVATLPIECSLTKEHVQVVRRLMRPDARPVIRFNAHIVCSVRDFEIQRHIETSHHRLVNFNVAG